MIGRRAFLVAGGAFLAGHGLRRAVAADVAEIVMKGDAMGSDVWFDPVGLLVPPGGTVRWRNDDPANSHTTTAYHPANRNHPLRIPANAKPWNSDYLLPDETYSVTFTVAGVYDFFCIPHEMAGMVGRIVVAAPGSPPPQAPVNDAELMSAARGGFPAVEEIMRLGVVHRK